MRNYTALFNGKETTIQADSSYQASLQAIAYFKPAKSKKHLVSVHLLDDDNAISIATTF